MNDYQFLPPLSEEEYQHLKNDIARRGVLVPVEVDEHGNILDGHHRVRACEELGIKNYPRIVRIGLSEEEKVEHAVVLNVGRRHLSPENRAILARNLREKGWSYRKIAEKLSISPATVLRDVRRISVFARNTRAFEAAVRTAKNTPSGDLRKHVSQEYVALSKLGRTMRKSTAEYVHHLDRTYSDLPSNVRIHLCPMQELQLEPESVDIVFTDPPWGREADPLFEDLASFSLKVLKEGGLLFVYVGAFFLPRRGWILERSGLRHITTIVETLPGRNKLLDGFIYLVQPILVFSKGKHRVPFSPIPTLIRVPKIMEENKTHHPWQRSVDVAEFILSRASIPGDTVVDPFLGSGTTGVATVRLGGRTFIGCDIDPVAFELAKDRIQSGKA